MKFKLEKILTWNFIHVESYCVNMKTTYHVYIHFEHYIYIYSDMT